MKLKIFTLLSFLTFIPYATAQNGNVDGKIWLDLFEGPAGSVLYPQYAWELKSRAGTLWGYGFLEAAPHEPGFTNNLVVYVPARLPQFSLWTETGGAPHVQDGFLFQVGPALNVQEVIPPLKRVVGGLFVAQLPSLGNARPPNTLIAGETKRFPFLAGSTISLKGFRRFFPGKRADYSEYWILVHPKRTKHISVGVFLLHHGSRMTAYIGVRVTS